VTVSPEPYLPQPDATYPAPAVPAPPAAYAPAEVGYPTQYAVTEPPPAVAQVAAYANGNGHVAAANAAAPTDLQVIDLSDAGGIPVVPPPRDAAPGVAATTSVPTSGATDGPAGLDAVGITAWFGTHRALDQVSLSMEPGKVTALIGPSGCGKSTFLRTLNRMHELIPGASMAGQVFLDGVDIYSPERRLTQARRQVGMVFQKPNPFPAMSIYDNVVAGLKLTGTKASKDERDMLVESCLIKAGLWKEVKDRLRNPGGGLSGGQQQRLCIARSLAIKPKVLLMDEPCSALDPTSTRRIEETIVELVSEVTIVIVTHNMQQAQRVSDNCAFFLAEQGAPGVIVEHGPTMLMFSDPQDSRTSDYVHGRFG
jgi:phosphate transport system ATP-binding protein